jgi:hypothetical protein
MRRRLFKLAAAVSSLAFALTVTLWLSAIWWDIEVRRLSVRSSGIEQHARQWILRSADAGLLLESSSALLVRTGTDDALDQKSAGWSCQLHGVFGPRMDFGESLRPSSDTSSTVPWWVEKAPRSYRRTDYYLPYWCILAVTLPLPTLFFARRQRRLRWLKQNHCVNCGYPLAGNTSGICPECGTAVPRNAKAKE